MADNELTPEEGRKGGSLEGSMAFPRYYEPTVTAVTDIVIPATRVQWGPIFAGLVVFAGFWLLFESLGIAVGFAAYGLGFWTIAFATVGLFLGSFLASRTAKAELVPAIVHAVVLWSLVLILSIIGFGRVAFGAIPAGGVNAWWFFIGYIIMLGGSILGGILGMSPVVRTEEQHTEVHT